MDEQWKVIGGFEDYSVSTAGRVRRNTARTNGVEGHIKVPTTLPAGYLMQCLYKNGRCKANLVHRLVATAFIPCDTTRRCVNHKNGNKADNRVENLEWVTPSENERHSYDVLKKKACGCAAQPPRRGSAAPTAKLTADQVRIIRAMQRMKPPHGWKTWLAKKWGVTQSCVSLIALGKNW
jgi:hypothetical protein